MPRENLVGQTIAGYALESEVGEGGTSSVFRGKHQTHGTVAVKVLREKLRTDKTAVARSLLTILERPAQRLIVGHADVIEGDCSDHLARAWRLEGVEV